MDERYWSKEAFELYTSWSCQPHSMMYFGKDEMLVPAAISQSMRCAGVSTVPFPVTAPPIESPAMALSLRDVMQVMHEANAKSRKSSRFID